MKTAVMVVCLVALATSVTGDEGFSLKDTTTGKTYGPFQFKDGSRVKIGETELTIVKPDPAQDRIVAMLKEAKFPNLDMRNAALSDLVEYLAKKPKNPDINIVLGPGVARADPITFSVRNATLYDVLGILCDIANLEWEIRHGVVMIDVKANQDAPVKKAESKVLGKAFAETLAEMAAQMERETGKLPPGATTPDYVARNMEMMKKRFPSLFMVSEKEEADFKAGVFHDDENKKSMKQSLRKLEEFDAALPSVSQFLIHELNEGKLEGAQLELAARLLAANVDEVRAKAEETDAEKMKPPDEK